MVELYRLNPCVLFKTDNELTMEYLNSANYTYPKIMSRISATTSHWNKYTFLKTNHVYITILFLLQYINFFFMLETSEKWEGRVLAVYPVLCCLNAQNLSLLLFCIDYIYIHNPELIRLTIANMCLCLSL
jgi:hypothetical protein